MGAMRPKEEIETELEINKRLLQRIQEEIPPDLRKTIQQVLAEQGTTAESILRNDPAVLIGKITALRWVLSEG